MSNIFESASKLTLLWTFAVSGVAFLLGILPQDMWMVLASMVAGYYFGSRDPNVTQAKAKRD